MTRIDHALVFAFAVVLVGDGVLQEARELAAPTAGVSAERSAADSR